ncbi:cytochrome c biogenesis protein CcsA [Geothrix sp. 21YS21S-4]|uniref:cytochrome c biogenesis protein CcsA n=1 Tax=Geothrix sp. 21YS21S-4 TaxID=3068889 RepID=UPI0027B957B9|nr:cytochrome c biogenesis protein CcsA [Geothrix sp. 21YS21S-4]
MRKLFEFLASLKLAVILLVLLLVGLSVGTIVETRSGVEEAGRLVYYAWWFLGLQGLFAINLAMSLADLFPWNQRRIGFVVTHASLILIFVGAAVTYFFKVEGNLSLWEGQSGSVIEHHVHTAGEHRESETVTRHQLPFTVKLDDFVLDTYPGTMRPAGFSSQVQITDSETGKTFPAKIWMNHEFHYRGYALFQSSYQQEEGREATVLAVSKDPGQLIVFAGYITLILGMLIVLFTRISQSRARAALEASITAANAGRGALLALLAVAGLGLHGAAPSPDALRRLPVQHDGRVMPLDTLARDMVWTVTGSSTWKGQDPVATMMGWMFEPNTGAEAPMIQVGSKALVKALDLPAGTTHASFVQLVRNPKLGALLRAAQMAEMEQRPLQGELQDVRKLESRLRAMQSIGLNQGVRPMPVSPDPHARWAVYPGPPADGLVQLAQGPRLEGWPSAAAMDREVFYNRLNPVRLAWIVLLASLAASVVAWKRQSAALDRVALGLLAAGFAVMTWGIALRWQVGGRIPAANMYESMLFLAWGVGLFALVAYALLKNRMVVLNAAVMATLTMALTDLLPIDRLIHPIAPVLAGTPWLAIHVPIIMVGYAVLALGLVVAHMQVGATIFAPRRVELVDRMYDLLYWYMFVGSIFLIAGIITGSMWAASSWGRYWGWDPKEVWSLVAFLAYMAILHAKLDRMIGKFGVAAISILAFQTIVMTYLGVNFVLTTGMHSYGMGDSPVVKWMIIVALAEIAFLGWGLWAHRRNPAVAE